MFQLDKTDMLLIALAVLFLGVHLLYSRHKKRREQELQQRNEKQQPQLWSDPSDKHDSR